MNSGKKKPTIEDPKLRIKRPSRNVSANQGWPIRNISLPINVAVIGAIAIIVAALIGIGPSVIGYMESTPIPPPTATPSCLSADDILVRFHILSGQQEIAVLAPGESIKIEPDLTVDLRVEIKSVSAEALPKLDCAWTNTGIVTEGKLLHKTGCNVDYRSGHDNVTDALSIQISQPSCIALPQYPFFILPK